MAIALFIILVVANGLMIYHIDRMVKESPLNALKRSRMQKRVEDRGHALTLIKNPSEDI